MGLLTYSKNAEKAYPAPIRENYQTGAEYATACRKTYWLRISHDVWVINMKSLKSTEPIHNRQLFDWVLVEDKPAPSLYQRIKSWLFGK